MMKKLILGIICLLLCVAAACAETNVGDMVYASKGCMLYAAADNEAEIIGQLLPMVLVEVENVADNRSAQWYRVHAPLAGWVCADDVQTDESVRAQMVKAFRSGACTDLTTEGYTRWSSFPDDRDMYPEGIFCVELNGKWGLLSEMGEVILPPIADERPCFRYSGVGEYTVTAHEGGLDEVIRHPAEYISYCANGRWGLIRVNGDEVTGAVWAEPVSIGSIGEDENGQPVIMAWSRKEPNGPVCVMNMEGQPLGEAANEDGVYHLALAKGIHEHTAENGLMGVMNECGEWVIQPAYDDVTIWSRDVVKVYRNGLAGVMDGEGCEVTPVCWSSVMIEDDRILCGSPNGNALLDMTGKVLAEGLDYINLDGNDNYIRSIVNGCLWTVRGDYGQEESACYDRNGVQVLPFTSGNICPHIGRSVYRVHSTADGKEWLTTYRYDGTQLRVEECMPDAWPDDVVKTEQGWGVRGTAMDEECVFLLPEDGVDMAFVADGLALVELAPDSYRLIDHTGCEVLTDLNLDSIQAYYWFDRVWFNTVLGEDAYALMDQFGHKLTDAPLTNPVTQRSKSGVIVNAGRTFLLDETGAPLF